MADARYDFDDFVVQNLPISEAYKLDLGIGEYNMQFVPFNVYGTAGYKTTNIYTRFSDDKNDYLYTMPLTGNNYPKSNFLRTVYCTESNRIMLENYGFYGSFLDLYITDKELKEQAKSIDTFPAFKAYVERKLWVECFRLSMYNDLTLVGYIGGIRHVSQTGEGARTYDSKATGVGLIFAVFDNWEYGETYNKLLGVSYDNITDLHVYESDNKSAIEAERDRFVRYTTLAKRYNITHHLYYLCGNDLTDPNNYSPSGYTILANGATTTYGAKFYSSDSGNTPAFTANELFGSMKFPYEEDNSILLTNLRFFTSDFSTREGNTIAGVPSAMPFGWIQNSLLIENEIRYAWNPVYIRNDENVRKYPSPYYTSPIAPTPPPYADVEPLPPINPGPVNNQPVGGNGDRDNTSNPIDIPTVPSLDIFATDLISAYITPTTSLQQLSKKLWSTDFLDQVKNFMSDVSDAIISLSAFPVSLPKENIEEIGVAGVSTGVQAYRLAGQYMQFDCGSIDMTEYFGSALDYSPYTRVSVFLPFIGTQELDIQDIMRCTVRLVYNIDLFTGACVAVLHCTRSDPVLQSVMYQFDGQMSSQFPITGRGRATLDTAIIGLIGNVGKALGGVPVIGNIMEMVGSTASNVAAGMLGVNHTGNLASSYGQLGVMYAYLIVSRPIQSLANNFGTFNGYPSNITAQIKQVRGFTKVAEVHVEGTYGTDEENREIERILKDGIIV